ncbi:4-aminobutyrate aminotransferase [Candida albicans P60002]|nr:4-aminobutyrate aminotransferase [Candida albicans P60002]
MPRHSSFKVSETLPKNMEFYLLWTKSKSVLGHQEKCGPMSIGI